MSSPSADHGLLFGVLALQWNFLSHDQLGAALNAWAPHPDRPFADVLREEGILGEDELVALGGLVEKHLGRHQHDARKSVAALESLDLLRRQLGPIANPR